MVETGQWAASVYDASIDFQSCLRGDSAAVGVRPPTCQCCFPFVKTLAAQTVVVYVERRETSQGLIYLQFWNGRKKLGKSSVLAGKEAFVDKLCVVLESGFVLLLYNHHHHLWLDCCCCFIRKLTVALAVVARCWQLHRHARTCARHFRPSYPATGCSTRWARAWTPQPPPQQAESSPAAAAVVWGQQAEAGATAAAGARTTRRWTSRIFVVVVCVVCYWGHKRWRLDRNFASWF